MGFLGGGGMIGEGQRGQPLPLKVSEKEKEKKKKKIWGIPMHGSCFFHLNKEIHAMRGLVSQYNFPSEQVSASGGLSPGSPRYLHTV